MRLDASAFGLLTCLIGLAAGKNSRDVRGSEVGAAGVTGTSTSSSSPNSVVVLDPAFPRPAVFAQSEGNRTITFKKGTGITDLTVTRAIVKSYADDTIIGEGRIPQTLSTGTAGSAEDSNETLDAKRRQQLPPLILPTTENSVTLPFENQIAAFGRWINLPLYIEFVWNNSTSSGTSSTPVFAVWTTQYDTAASNLQDTATGSNPARPESITSSSETTDGSPSSTSTSEAGQTNSSGGNQKLSPGAIAGIAVGCAIAAILIIALIAWFFCFRRRGGQRSHDPNVSYGSDSVTQHAMIGDKEIPGISESTPHSTHGGEDGAAGSGVGAAAGGPFSRPSLSMAPYTDRAPSPTLTPPPPPPPAGVAAVVSGHKPSHSRSDSSITNANANTNTNTATREIGAGAGAQSSTPPATSRYAHLVEEGMTDAEIRRLEEEERHLDEAIEDAGRHRRTSSR